MHIATVYGIEERALVMGADLKGPLPVEEAIATARQIAAGLEAAHEKGIIHRDLKPANINLTPDGVVKILDFGLAKTAGEATASTAAMSADMSCEQAHGKVVDKRTDIWAFGVVLCEIETGKQRFRGEDLTETLAS